MRNIFTLVTVALLLDGGTIFAAGNSNHHGAVFVGNTTTDKSKSAFTIGLDYEYLLPTEKKQLSGLVILDYATFDDPVFIAAAGVVWRPKGGVKFLSAIGHEWVSSHSASMYRLGVGYDIHLSKVSITPVFNYDRIGSHYANVYGVDIGFGF
ncbi:MAG: hypothetical protein HRU19_00745 [Pseudobacteriovorax sp.]|nr:hypothetical protein [Pseudobacteriovorax sp.]